MRILIIDDDQLDRNAYKRYLKSCSLNFWTEEVSYGTGALTKIHENDYDCVLLDYYLPDLDALEFLDVLTVDDFCSVPVVVITGLDNGRHDIDLLKAGAQDYLTKKEINSQILERSISFAIARHKLTLEINAINKNIDSLRELIPICAYCKSIREDGGYWSDLESYITDKAKIDITEALCPDCCNESSPVKQILIVDDDELDRKRIKRILDKHKDEFIVTEANCGTDGLAYLQDDEYDCLILDYDLPDICGSDFVKLMPTFGIDTPVIFVSGTEDRAHVEKMNKSKNRGYFNKNELSTSLFILNLDTVINSNVK